MLLSKSQALLSNMMLQLACSRILMYSDIDCIYWMVLVILSSYASPWCLECLTLNRWRSLAQYFSVRCSDLYTLL